MRNHIPTVLVVDDHVSILQAIAFRLQSAKFKVVTARDCASGAMKARQSQPDIALLDICLPGGDGFELARRIDMICGKPIKKIFITASCDRSFRERAKACGAADFLEKPFTTGTLLAAVCLADDSSLRHRA